MPAPIKIFLSSTSKDLGDYRTQVIARLRRLDGVNVVAMEDFGARSGSPKTFCLEKVHECNLYVGIIGQLYGFVPEEDEKSLTEQEYQAAADAGRDRLVFLAPDNFAVPVSLVLEDT